jgi:hypothetical protein
VIEREKTVKDSPTTDLTGIEAVTGTEVMEFLGKDFILS